MNIVLKKYCPFIIAFLFLFVAAQSFKAQSSNTFYFKGNPEQVYGFDRYHYPEWRAHYAYYEKEHFYAAYKTVALNQEDLVDFHIPKGKSLQNLRFEDTLHHFIQPFRIKNDTLVTLKLPKRSKSYRLQAFYKKRLVGVLEVKTFDYQQVDLVLIPMSKGNFSTEDLTKKLNYIYSQALITFNIDMKPYFKIENEDSSFLLNNPILANDRYTPQMRSIRNAYFEKFPDANPKKYYVFLTEGFIDPSISGFMVHNKSIAFVSTKADDLAYAIAKELGHGVGILKDTWIDGPKKGSTKNLLDEGEGTHLTYKQWLELRHSSNSYSIYDNYEDVKTDNGFIAYYFWELDENQQIQVVQNNFLKSIHRPFKKNTLSYHLRIKSFDYKTLFTVLGYPICLWHILLWISGFFLIRYLRKKIHRFFKERIRYSWFIRAFSRLIFITLSGFLYYGIFLFVNGRYDQFIVEEGNIKAFDLKPLKNVELSIASTVHPKKAAEQKKGTEIMYRKKGGWYLMKKKQVLYFHVIQDSNGQVSVIRFLKDSDRLILRNGLNQKAESHYMVVNYYNPKREYVTQKVLNHTGVDLTEKLNLEDPAKRILLFINGYRPTTVGHSLEDNIKDIETHGLEFPNSTNRFYTFDRYDYWRPWHEIDLLFEKRINPTNTFYGDGHFSVATSNHKSLLNFTTVSSIYPNRCKDPKHHQCKEVEITNNSILGKKTISTKSLQNTDPNYEGFNFRRKNGKIAGKNLLQILNEIPNRSNNDTLFIVAHSMGYAYSLGIIDELRGKINFGEFYIIAPENASSGYVHRSEWKQIWQYGSNYQADIKKAPCLLDGIAPQSKVGGLSEQNRVYIPSIYYHRMGFFDSHFVGYYTWIFDIPPHQKGNIPQR